MARMFKFKNAQGLMVLGACILGAAIIISLSIITVGTLANDRDNPSLGSNNSNWASPPGDSPSTGQITPPPPPNNPDIGVSVAPDCEDYCDCEPQPPIITPPWNYSLPLPGTGQAVSAFFSINQRSANLRVGQSWWTNLIIQTVDAITYWSISGQTDAVIVELSNRLHVTALSAGIVYIRMQSIILTTV